VTEAPFAAFTGATMWLFVVLELMFFLFLDFAPSRRRKFPYKWKGFYWFCFCWVSASFWDCWEVEGY
jgi:hypothetical protein